MDGMALVRRVFATYPFKSVNGRSITQSDGDDNIDTLSTCVLKTGDQEITGIKIFSGDLVFSGNPTFSGDPVFSGSPSFPETLTWKLATTTKTANYTVTVADAYIRADSTSGAITLTLPTASTCTGQVFVFKRISAGANAVTIAGTIDGATNLVLGTQYQAVCIISNGTAWEVF